MERTTSERRLLEVSSGDQYLSPNRNEPIASLSADVHQQQQQQQQQQQAYLQPPEYCPPPQSVQFQTASAIATSQPPAISQMPAVVATQQQTGYQRTGTPSMGQLHPDYQVPNFFNLTHSKLKISPIRTFGKINKTEIVETTGSVYFKKISSFAAAVAGNRPHGQN